MEECEHGSDPSTCSVCQGPPPKEERRVSHPFPARYESWCRGCSMTIYKGERIVKITEGASETYEHHGCAL